MRFASDLDGGRVGAASARNDLETHRATGAAETLFIPAGPVVSPGATEPRASAGAKRVPQQARSLGVELPSVSLAPWATPAECWEPRDVPCRLVTFLLVPVAEQYRKTVAAAQVPVEERGSLEVPTDADDLSEQE